MVVKNINKTGPSGNTKPIPIHHIIPPTGAANVKVTIDTGSEEIDVTEVLLRGNFNIGVSSAYGSLVGDFSIEFLDPSKTNYNKIENFHDVYIYSNYGQTATTKRFRFKIESRGYSNFKTILSGRGIGMILADKSIIYRTLDSNGDLTQRDKSEVLTEIIQENFPEITDFSQIEEDTVQIQKSYYEVPFLDVIEDLCGTDKYFYLDKDLIPNYFTKGTRTNNLEAVSDNNLVTINENAQNAEEVYTRVRVYGRTEDNIPIISTKDVGTLNTKGINKDYIIRGNSITTEEQANALAEYEANNLENSTKIGGIVSLILPNLIPGESLFISLPEHNIEPDYYNIKEFTIEIDNLGDYVYKTNFTIEKKRLNLPRVSRKTIQSQKKISQNDNPSDLDFTKIITFKEDTGTHNGTIINENYLKVAPGQSTGSWTSPIFTVGSQITDLAFRWAGELLTGTYGSTSSQMFFSLDGGSSWKLVMTGDSSRDVTIPTGRDMRIRLVLNQENAKVKRVGIYHKL